MKGGYRWAYMLNNLKDHITSLNGISEHILVQLSEKAHMNYPDGSHANSHIPYHVSYLICSNFN